MICPGNGQRVRRVADFKGRHFTGEVILWAVRWHLMFPVSYRDLELMLADRGVEVDRTTIFRWIQAYAGELEKRLRPHLRSCNGSWRVDETYIKIASSLCGMASHNHLLIGPPRLPTSWRFLVRLQGAVSSSRPTTPRASARNRGQGWPPGHRALARDAQRP